MSDKPEHGGLSECGHAIARDTPRHNANVSTKKLEGILSCMVLEQKVVILHTKA